jgi:NAD(P)H-dependent FMN reductase
MNYLLFSGSLRTESLNKKLVDVAQRILSQNPENKAQTVDLRDFEIPLYDGDIEEKNGIPTGVQKLGEHIQMAQGLILSSPEYNGSIAGPLKNTLDWITRLRPMPLANKPVLLLGASPGGFGGVRALTFTRVPLESVGCFVYPQTFALPKAHEVLSQHNPPELETETKKKLSELLNKFDLYARKLSIL